MAVTFRSPLKLRSSAQEDRANLPGNQSSRSVPLQLFLASPSPSPSPEPHPSPRYGRGIPGLTLTSLS
ncbi:hypothetical protein RRG08_026620 [Elysia crispata]|uniref:Uncharacterized protein n=1 Tax=Elysia crispata TaxID=231223 RepID=A0AAE1E829_9GAST|nr:hypothetical protein RRG08_026620 [Elysia crispata]